MYVAGCNHHCSNLFSVFNRKNDERKTALHIVLELKLHPHAMLLIELENSNRLKRLLTLAQWWTGG